VAALMKTGDIDPKNLSGIYKELYTALSDGLTVDQAVRATVAVAELFGGESIYFPKIGKLTKELRNAEIIKEFDGSNTRQLSKKFLLTVAYIRKILKSK
jgi:Mor family transcriptional regulator